MSSMIPRKELFASTAVTMSNQERWASIMSSVDATASQGVASPLILDVLTRMEPFVKIERLTDTQRAGLQDTLQLLDEEVKDIPGSFTGMWTNPKVIRKHLAKSTWLRSLTTDLADAMPYQIVLEGTIAHVRAKQSGAVPERRKIDALSDKYALSELSGDTAGLAELAEGMNSLSHAGRYRLLMQLWDKGKLTSAVVSRIGSRFDFQKLPSESYKQLESIITEANNRLDDRGRVPVRDVLIAYAPSMIIERWRGVEGGTLLRGSHDAALEILMLAVQKREMGRL